MYCICTVCTVCTVCVLHIVCTHYYTYSICIALDHLPLALGGRQQDLVLADPATEDI